MYFSIPFHEKTRIFSRPVQESSDMSMTKVFLNELFYFTKSEIYVEKISSIHPMTFF